MLRRGLLFLRFCLFFFVERNRKLNPLSLAHSSSSVDIFSFISFTPSFHPIIHSETHTQKRSETRTLYLAVHLSETKEKKTTSSLSVCLDGTLALHPPCRRRRRRRRRLCLSCRDGPRRALAVKVARQALPAPVVLPVHVRARRRRRGHAGGQMHLEHEGEGAVGGRRRDLVLFVVAAAVSELLSRRRGVEGCLVRAVRGPRQVKGGPAG